MLADGSAGDLPRNWMKSIAAKATKWRPTSDIFGAAPKTTPGPNSARCHETRHTLSTDRAAKAGWVRAVIIALARDTPGVAKPILKPDRRLHIAKEPPEAGRHAPPDSGLQGHVLVMINEVGMGAV